MRAYYFDNIPGDQRLPHDYIPSRPVSLDVLSKLGVKYWTIPVEGHEPEIDRISGVEGYKNRDTINVSKEGLGEDEEIRYILGGSGFFDVRGTPASLTALELTLSVYEETPTDAWIRIGVEPGDLLVIPEGIYHRFTLDEANNIKALRLFKDEPKWIPYNRSTETEVNPHRVDYLKSIGVGA
ncbi:1,2-dihydroxy-3-keto-5-methylthiopentene dioxygenase 1 [Asterophora parasitica]|uniref:Probable inactive acireductone dioxygenase n=1 Tax=Asterophora parasitica TaxID=117018 RepID=A0A9P7FZZ1_9AGAR|nr:1,2-dihydroxy-3-keto-5-methylthiopentene dioxygenase 1 [Asterophora parasitica]